MDPVSAIGLVASLGQLAGAAKDLVLNMYQYFDAVKSAPKRSQELRQEMALISDLLDVLEDMVKTASPQAPFQAQAALEESISGFQEILGKMNARITIPQTKGFKRLSWPFTRDENDSLLSKMERYKASFSLALNIKNS